MRVWTWRDEMREHAEWAKSIIPRFKKFPEGFTWDPPRYVETIEALPADCTHAEALAATEPFAGKHARDSERFMVECSECESHFMVALRVGYQADYEQSFTFICLSCAISGVSMLEREVGGDS